MTLKIWVSLPIVLLGGEEEDEQGRARFALVRLPAWMTLTSDRSHWRPSQDVAGQPKFRNMWERYCRGVQAIV